MAEIGLDSPITRDNAPGNFLKLFYPYHYNVGMALEKALSNAVLDRHQTVILWLIHSQGSGNSEIPRKLIERQIGEWYELGSPAISKALRKLARPPLALIAIDESKNSGREKTIRLTDAGRRFVGEMMAKGNAFIARIVEHLSDAQIHAGMDFMARVSEIVDRDFEPSSKPSGGPATG